MKLQLTYKLSLVLVLISCICNSQDKKDKERVDNFDHYAYMEPIDNYKALLEEGLDETSIYKKLGNANYHNANYDVATYWYEKLLLRNEVSVSPDYLYRYALALKSIKRYDESDEWMTKFKRIKSSDSRAKLFSDNDEYLKRLQAPSNSYTVEPLETLNSEESDFAPSLRGDLLIFSTARDLEMQEYNPLPYLNLYQTTVEDNNTVGTVAPFSSSLNTKANESSTSFSSDGKTMYFTRNNFSKKSFKRDKKGVSRLKIYRSQFINGSWSEAEDLPFNGTKYSVAHPTLSADGKQLYFASDMPGGMGASDIYVVEVKEDGSFGEPKNLGKPINTEGKETFPFISKKGTLYFSSDGHQGLGGLDVFKSQLDENKEVENLGSPINSPYDDFSLILNDEEIAGYFASNRKGGKGSDDIYYLQRSDIECLITIDGTANDKDTDHPLADTVIEAFDSEGRKIGETVSNSSGAYSLEIACQEKQYQITGKKEGYEEGNLFMLTTSDNKHIEGTKIELEESSKVAGLGSDLVKILELSPIYFDLNSSYLRQDAIADLDKVVDYMTRRPDIKIAVGSHTDSRESDDYNMWLSKRRAKRTVDYIISKGVNASRISGEGYGETQLLNKCSNGVKCPESEHQLNRRSEFIVIQK
ncbi:MAG: flagellar motor protein MotB [Pseudozobellia sp.]|nr:flagellar motor protein MotB [Pseudozobellia sp.]MBG49780.1 flagellar motor protein MotB [Pseudozobellia sp.]